jgi:nucleoporin NUP159
LEDLRSAFAVAKEGAGDLFSPKRILPVASAKVNIVAFASNDTRLVVGLENGSISIYDTTLLFTPGTGEVPPLKVMQAQSSPLRQIVPNPSTDANLGDLLAIVGDGKVVLLNTQLELQGGWTASDLMTQPISSEFSAQHQSLYNKNTYSSFVVSKREAHSNRTSNG